MTGPLLDLLERAARGRPPPADGAVEVLPPPPGPVDAVLAFTAHHVVAAAVPAAAVRAQLRPADLGAPVGARFLLWLAGRLGSPPGSLDLVLAADGLAGLGGAAPLELRAGPAPAAHPRVARAASYRTALEVLADPAGTAVLVLGRGVAGRRELAFEVAPAARGRGLGRALALAARRRTPRGEPLFAQVAPGNVASLRVLLAAGFRPVGAEVLFLRGQGPGNAGAPGAPA